MNPENRDAHRLWSTNDVLEAINKFTSEYDISPEDAERLVVLMKIKSNTKLSTNEQSEYDALMKGLKKKEA